MPMGHRLWPWRRSDQALSRQALGRRSEALAVRHLAAQGYTIERTHVRCRAGEIDVVAKEGDVLCFVEVRSTTSDAWGGPLATITAAKRRRLMCAAEWYLARRGSPAPACRFDVVAVSWASAQPDIQVLRGAFDASR